MKLEKSKPRPNLDVVPFQAQITEQYSCGKLLLNRMSVEI
jgi:hypothetical protein